jgi:aspartate carbamoyltransferase catalytic subunit
MKTRFDPSDVAAAVDQLFHQVTAAFAPDQPINVVGIRTRGSILANRIVARLRQTGYTLVDHGVIDVTLYRDDIARLGPRPLVGKTRLDLEIDGKPLLLVDDVLSTGRTLRAAMDAIADFGRPGSLKTAVLVDRGGRELPISADFAGLRLADVPADRRVNVRFRELDGKDAIVVEPAAIPEPEPRPRSAGWRHRHLLSLEELSPDEIRFILDTADSFKEVSTRSVKKVPALRGRVVVNAFFEDSTRTRMSFSLAAQRLSADLIDFSEQGSSVSKGETLIDTARNIEAMGVDIIVIRHKAAGAAQLLARTCRTSIINAGDGAHEHPTQGLLDLYTIRERFGRIEGLKVAIVGDIANSRVARSDLWGLKKLGAEVILVGPPTLLPKSFEQLGCRVCHRLDDVIGEVDAIQMLRVQNERMKTAQFPTVREFTQLFGLTWDRFQRCKKDVFVMHPGPMNRGIEIQSDIADGGQSGILTQVTNGLAVRMAVLYLVSQAAPAEGRRSG